MKKKIKDNLYQYTCERCDYEWVQRPIVIRGEDGKKIKKINLNDPENCSMCKSPSWDIPRV